MAINYSILFPMLAKEALIPVMKRCHPSIAHHNDHSQMYHNNMIKKTTKHVHISNRKTRNN